MKQISIDVYNEIKSSGVLSKRRMQVFDCLYKFKSLNNKQISQITGLPINSVTPRVNELVSFGVVVEDKIGKCPLTGYNSTFWCLSGEKPIVKKKNDDKEFKKACKIVSKYLSNVGLERIYKSQLDILGGLK